MPVMLTLMFPLLLLSTLLGLMAINWMTLWLSMELNLMVFLPLVSYRRISGVAEVTGKYFVAQSAGSLFFLLGVGTSCVSPVSLLAGALMSCGLLAKAGVAPLHQWFTAVSVSLPWVPMMLLLTWQKVLPLLSFFLLDPVVGSVSYLLLSGLNGVVGAAGGLNQSQLRPLLAFSSIGHMGWAIGLDAISVMAGGFYLVGYIVLSLPLALIYIWGGVTSVKVTTAFTQMNPTVLFFHSLSLLSLGGMPPFAGFFLKGGALQLLVSHQLVVLALVLIVCSAVSLGFYTNVVLLAVLMPFLTYGPRANSQSVTPVFFLCLVGLLGLPVLLESGLVYGDILLVS